MAVPVLNIYLPISTYHPHPYICLQSSFKASIDLALVTGLLNLFHSSTTLFKKQKGMAYLSGDEMDGFIVIAFLEVHHEME